MKSKKRSPKRRNHPTPDTRAGGCKEFHRECDPEHWKWHYYYGDERYDHLYQSGGERMLGYSKKELIEKPFSIFNLKEKQSLVPSFLTTQMIWTPEKKDG